MDAVFTAWDKFISRLDAGASLCATGVRIAASSNDRYQAAASGPGPEAQKWLDEGFRDSVGAPSLRQAIEVSNARRNRNEVIAPSTFEAQVGVSNTWSSFDLRQQILHHPSCDVGQSEIPARVSVRKLLVIESKLVQQRRMEVVYVHLVLRGSESKLVRRAINRAFFKAAPSYPHGEAVRIVITAVRHSAVRAHVG